MKTMCHPVYHKNGFVASHALGHMKYGYILLVPMNQKLPLYVSGEKNIYIYIYNINIIYIFIPSKMLTFSDVTILQHISKLRLMSVG